MWCSNGLKPEVKITGRAEGVAGGGEAHESSAVPARRRPNGIEESPECGTCALRVAHRGLVAGEDNWFSEKKLERSS